MVFGAPCEAPVRIRPCSHPPCLGPTLTVGPLTECSGHSTSTPRRSRAEPGAAKKCCGLDSSGLRRSVPQCLRTAASARLKDCARSGIGAAQWQPRDGAGLVRVPPTRPPPIPQGGLRRATHSSQVGNPWAHIGQTLRWGASTRVRRDASGQRVSQTGCEVERQYTPSHAMPRQGCRGAEAATAWVTER